MRGTQGFPGGTIGKGPICNAGDISDRGSIPGLGRSLEKGTTTHSSILAWKIPWTEEPGGPLSVGSQSQIMTEATYHACMHKRHSPLNKSLMLDRTKPKFLAESPQIQTPRNSKPVLVQPSNELRLSWGFFRPLFGQQVWSELRTQNTGGYKGCTQLVRPLSKGNEVRYPQGPSREIITVTVWEKLITIFAYNLGSHARNIHSMTWLFLSLCIEPWK